MTTVTHRFTDHVRGMAAFQSLLRRAPERVSAQVMRTAHNIALILEACVKDRAPSMTGTLVSSFLSRVSPLGRAGAEAAVTSPLPYAQIVDTGRKAGKMPPWGVGSELHRWVQLKVRRGEMTAAEDDVESIAFLIARSIGRHGTKPTNYIRRAANKARPLIAAELEAMSARIQQDWDGL